MNHTTTGIIKWLLLLLGGFSASAQDLQKIHPDTFYVTDKNEIAIEALRQPGIVYRDEKLKEYPTKFWIEGNIYFSGSARETDALYVFGIDSAGSPEFWAAGYSLNQKHILLYKIAIGEGGEIRLIELAKKPVEIIDHRNQNVYRIIFIHQTNEIKIEVNGVPLLTKCPLPTKEITYYGYLVKGKLARFEKMRVNGE